MKFLQCTRKLDGYARRTSRLAHSYLPAILAVIFLAQTRSAVAALSFGRGTATSVGSIQFSSVPDSVILTGALTGPGTIDSSLNIPANRIQYDVINSDQGTMKTWTVYYSTSVGPNIIGATTPIGYVTSSGTTVPQGGVAYATLFNAGYGVYSYNTGAPWTIEYQADHITFIAATNAPGGLPANDGAGYVMPTPYLPSFDILFNPDLTDGLVSASATLANTVLSGQVYGPLDTNVCLSIQCTNITLQTCSNCVKVAFAATTIDTCCSNVTLQYNPPSGTCFPLGSTTIVEVTGIDACGNYASNTFTVTVVPGPNCASNKCVSISCSNLVAYTCSNCTTVPFTAFAIDNCCAGAAPPTLVYYPPQNTCFPVGSTTVVSVTAYDDCNNFATNSFTVTVLPNPNCDSNKCISVSCTNIVAYTCSNCATVSFSAVAMDNCCPSATGAASVKVTYNPPDTTCFPVGSTNTVEVTAYDDCGNIATNTFTVTVLPDPNCASGNCISIYPSNVVAYTCSNCTTVPFSVIALDTCCPGAAGPTVTYSPSQSTCFPVNSTNLVGVTAFDDCGNISTSYFSVTVLPATNCGGNNNSNCISIYCSNVVAFTCSNCATVSFPVKVVDICCATTAGPTVVYNPPETTCFPVNSTNLVEVSAYDNCGNIASKSFTVTVLQGPNCGQPELSIASAPNRTNIYSIAWPSGGAQLQQSTDLIHWYTIPDATNSPYMITNPGWMGLYRLKYR